MSGMLLAAGKATRMEPLSSLFAKAALDVLGRPLLASALDHLRRFAGEPVVVNLHRHPEQVAAAARDAAGTAAALRFSFEPALLGGAGGVAAARALLGPGPVLAANADVWADLDLASLAAAGGPGDAVLALLPHPDPARWSSVLLAADGRVAELAPAGAPLAGTPYLFTGVQWLGSEVVAALPPPPAEWRDVWQDLRSRGRLRGVVVAGRWHEAGTPAAYRELVMAELGARSWVHAQAAVAGRARVRRTAIGAGCRVEAGAAVAGSVLCGGAVLSRGSLVERCVVAGPVRVEAGEALADSLVLPDRRLALAQLADRT